MTRGAPSPTGSKAPPQDADVKATGEQHRDLPAWSKLGENSVPVRNEAGHATVQERAARLRLILGRRLI